MAGVAARFREGYSCQKCDMGVLHRISVLFVFSYKVKDLHSPGNLFIHPLCRAPGIRPNRSDVIG